MMKRLVGGIVTLVAGTLVAASVYDDARVWFRGGYDANGDGAFSATEFVDSARPKTDSGHQMVKLAGAGARYAKGDVHSAYNPLYTNNQYYVSLTNGGCTAAADCTSAKLVNPLLDEERWNNYTIFMRIRWDGRIPLNDNNGIDATSIELLNTDQNWNNRRGVRFLLKYFPETDDFTPYWVYGMKHFKDVVPTETKGFKLPVGEWLDLIFTIQDPGVGNNAIFKCYVATAGTLSVPETWKGTAAWVWLSEEHALRRVALEPSDNVTFAPAAFSGDIAAWAIWPRLLTTDEMREACADPRPGDALFRLGKEDGKADEFAAAGAAQTTVDAHGTWDVVPQTLDTTCDTMTISFDVSTSYHELNQLLRVTAAAGRGRLAATLTDTNRGTSCDLGVRKVFPGQPASFFIARNQLFSGPHTLTIRRVDGAVTLDAIELGSSFCLGKITWQLSPINPPSFTASSGMTYYDLVTGYWPGLCGEIRNDKIDENPDSLDETTLFFDMTAEQVACTNILTLSYNQFKNSAAPAWLNGYINDTRVYHTDKAYQYEVYKITLPPGTCAVGQNCFRLRWENTEQWWGSLRGVKMEVTSEPPQPHDELVILVR